MFGIVWKGVFFFFSLRFLSFFTYKDFIYLFFRETGMEGERKGEKHQCVVASHAPQTGDLARNTCM